VVSGGGAVYYDRDTPVDNRRDLAKGQRGFKTKPHEGEGAGVAGTWFFLFFLLLLERLNLGEYW
jgi:hypothetical protein